MIHAVKCEIGYFEQIAAGLKPYELRKDDRNYKVGDFLALNEVEYNAPGIANYTGRCLITQITNIVNDNRFLMDGIVALTLKPCKIEDVTNSKGLFGKEYYKVAAPTVYDNEVLQIEKANE